MKNEKALGLRHPLVRQLIALIAMAATVWATLATGLPNIDFGPLAWDKARHVLAYAFLMWWTVQAFPRCRPGFCAAFLLLAGVCLELLQLRTGTRQGDLGDLIANAVGVSPGYALLVAPLGRKFRG